MSVFDTYADNPFVIKDEGQEITVRVQRTSPTTLQVSWNLPTKIQCGSSAGYNGAIITLDQTPTNLSKLPVDGTVYNADATADANLNAGDRIGTALVIGAFYDDTTTTSFNVTDAPEHIPYYVSLHAVDAQYRYHTDGVHSYSLPFNNGKTDQPTAGFQYIKLGSSGVTANQPTYLSPAATYTMHVESDQNHSQQHCYGQTPNGGYNFTVSGINSPTYGVLVDTLNAQVIASLNPVVSSSVPGTGYYWYDSTSRVVKAWNGTKDVVQDAIILGQDPLNPSSNGLYWYDTTTTQLFQYTTGVGYQSVDYIKLGHDPRQPICDDYWLKTDTNQLYRWNGTIWQVTTMYQQVTDPSLANPVTCASYWFDGTNLYNRDDVGCVWNLVKFYAYPTDFTQLVDGMLWINTAQNAVYEALSGVWQLKSAFTTKPTNPAPSALYLDTVNDIVEYYSTSGWTQLQAFVAPFDPKNPPDGTIWKASSGFMMWDTLSSSWVSMDVDTSATDPSLPPVLAQGVVWYDDVAGTFSKLVGTSWVDVTGSTIQTATKPQNLLAFLWFNPTTQTFSKLANGMLNQFVPVWTDCTPFVIDVGRLWYNPSTQTLSIFNGTTWSQVAVYQVPYAQTVGAYYYNATTNTLMNWNGKEWVVVPQPLVFELTPEGNIKITSSTLGSHSWVRVSHKGTLLNATVLNLPIHVEHPTKGTDPVADVPSYMQLGVGTDGSQDERRDLVDQLKKLLGYPIVEVELTKEQMDVAIDNALKELRYKSGAGYKRCMFFLEIEPHQQQYILSDSTVGFNKVVDVLYLHRMTSAYLGTGVGAGVYGQIAIQQLYTYGKFDLVSYHLVAGYIELMKQLFATEIQFQWDEYNRKLSIYKDFYIREKVLVDAVIEKTEQEILTDRWTAKWVQKYALAQCRLMLAEIRGKYTTVVAAGGQVTLNATDLRQRADKEMEECMQEIDDYIVSNKEDWGSASDLIIG
jgi:hypothetical protein